MVYLELERRGYDIGYLRTREGWEVDFCAVQPLGKSLLVQVCSDVNSPETLERELRALQSVSPLYPDAASLLITLDSAPPKIELPKNIQWYPAIEWLLNKNME